MPMTSFQFGIGKVNRTEIWYHVDNEVIRVARGNEEDDESAKEPVYAIYISALRE